MPGKHAHEFRAHPTWPDSAHIACSAQAKYRTNELERAWRTLGTKTFSRLVQANTPPQSWPDGFHDKTVLAEGGREIVGRHEMLDGAGDVPVSGRFPVPQPTDERSGDAEIAEVQRPPHDRSRLIKIQVDDHAIGLEHPADLVERCMEVRDIAQPVPDRNRIGKAVADWQAHDVPDSERRTFTIAVATSVAGEDAHRRGRIDSNNGPGWDQAFDGQCQVACTGREIERLRIGSDVRRQPSDQFPLPPAVHSKGKHPRKPVILFGYQIEEPGDVRLLDGRVSEVRLDIEITEPFVWCHLRPKGVKTAMAYMREALEQRFDAVIVGAGPAGSASAALLASRGFSVALLERAAFPRPKPCAEYLSPEVSRLLDRILPPGALERVRPARLHGMRVVSPDGTSFTGRFSGSRRYGPYREHGLALPREDLDHALALAAVARGATLFEKTAAIGFGDSDSGTRTLVIRRGRFQRSVVGRLIIGADGLNSRVARLLGVARRGRLRRIALVSHATDVTDMQALGEMHVGPCGYLGLAPVGRNVTNLSVVVDVRRSPPGRSKNEWFFDQLQRYPRVMARLEQARFVSPVRVVGPFASRARRATADHVMLVGDAADFYDPFTGEGIYAALRGAELVADQACSALETNALHAGALSAYDAARRRTFGGKWIVERLIGKVIAHPPVLNRVARRLAENPALADMLVGVTGNVVPTSEVLRPSFAWRLIR